jgi:hypothetical protein
MDLCRPATPDAARRIVEEAAAAESPVLKRDFYNSLCAAFTVDEVKDQVRHARQEFQVAQVSERHMLVKGVLA